MNAGGVPVTDDPRYDGVISCVIEPDDAPATFVGACGRCSFVVSAPADAVGVQTKLSDHIVTAHNLRRHILGLLAVDPAVLRWTDDNAAPIMPPLAVEQYAHACPACGAGPGEWCRATVAGTLPPGTTLSRPHSRRPSPPTCDE